ncbi:MAG TPA: poly-gamma-glutamate synthase PgsB [Bacillota bacterium]|nr:poly-gamma-glutamate synthase PgsB [Bacillota bacterium]HOH09798.1 poly-gamma-glutamate synthase PgsB [Bacillota bacterium]HOY88660.1 poly-gamma-glutamate synthase PgsB [Bacillota bacterium]HPI01887.1 poly-gamma-glutamate synthase PgsB [Bacillota bacterium]HPM63806.1 poly-gamma-glutamate synthase PgsB [Bacillota bacterium]
MNDVTIIAAFVLLLAAGLYEAGMHRRRIARFKIRVNVNGTRGKSTVTRLIAAGLSAAGIRTVAKTTGTTPRIILPDGTEEPIRRRGRARISEHVWVAKRALAADAKALVVECMALEEENQRIYEHMLVRSTIGVITNIRKDHLDVMGPELDDVARTLAITIPKNGHLVTVDGPFTKMLKERCEAMGTELRIASGDSVSPEELAMFGYTSFAENVAVALAVCDIAGVDRQTALKGMLAARPDPGVSPVADLLISGRKMHIVNAFAANDVESTMKMWEDFAMPLRSSYDRSFIMVNNREDRPQRVGEMSRLAAGLRPDRVFYVGKLQHLAMRLTPGGYEGASALHERTPDAILERVADELPENATALVFLAGNTKGAGSLLTEHIQAMTAESGGSRA